MGPGHFRACPAAPPPPAPRRPGEGGGSRAGGPAAPCVHSVHGQRGRPRARLRRPVRSAAEGVPRSRLRHQLHPGRRSRPAPGLCLGGEGKAAPGTPRPGSPGGEATDSWLGRCRSRRQSGGEGGRGGLRSAVPRAAPRPQVHEQVLYTASHDGALRLWDVRGLPCAPPPRPAAPARSRSRLFSNKVGCAAEPLPPA